MLLYIPFWLYSNVSGSATGICAKKLYIPFWLYSNGGVWKDAESVFRLYIPFWLYSNSLYIVSLIDTIIFTFHSGYILINCYKLQNFSKYSFTFHSGYILIIRLHRKGK